MVRIITNDELCCEITLNTATYNLTKLSGTNSNTNLSPNIVSVDLSSRTKKGDLLKAIIDLHELDENAHKTLFNKKINTEDLADVAISGAYSDLTGTPTIPVVNNAALTITQGGITKGTFSANAASDVTIEIDNTDISGKANVDLSNCTKPHIVETYVNGTSWYRVYSDGWCEQGGQATVGTSYEPVAGNTITLLKPYANTNYTVLIGGREDRLETTRNPGAKVINNSSFAIITGNDAVYFYWQACGYTN